MSRNDQAALVVNQATAVIVVAYLEHSTAMVEAGKSGFDVEDSRLITVINTVQDALRSF
jgi:hypothetical protein